MKSSRLSKLEKHAVQLLLDLFPQWKRRISEQIDLSWLQREQEFSNYSVYFVNNAKTRRIEINKKMPIEIILGNVDILDRSKIININGCNIISPCILSVPDNDAIGIRFYFCNGILSEIEVYSLSGKQICGDLPLEKQRTYLIFDETLIEHARQGTVCVNPSKKFRHKGAIRE